MEGLDGKGEAHAREHLPHAFGLQRPERELDPQPRLQLLPHQALAQGRKLALAVGHQQGQALPLGRQVSQHLEAGVVAKLQVVGTPGLLRGVSPQNEGGDGLKQPQPLLPRAHRRGRLAQLG